MDPDKKYCLFTESSKHSWSGIIIQYTEHTQEAGAKIKVPHPITYQRCTCKALRKIGSALTKRANGIYMSFHKMVFYLKDSHILIQCDHAPSCKFIYSVTKNNKVNNSLQEIHSIAHHIEFEHIKGKENVLTDSLS